MTSGGGGGIGRVLARYDLAHAALVAAAAGLAFLLAYRLMGANNLYEFCQYADIARNWTSGHGYSTRIVEPGVLAELEARGVPYAFPFPVAYRFPLYASLVALSVRLFGFGDFPVALVNGAVHAALAGLIVLLGGRLYGARSSRLAGWLYATSPVFTARYALSGFSDLVFALTLLPLHVLLARPGRWSRGAAAGAGALTGLAYLARFNVSLFVPVYALLVWRRTDRRGFALFLLAAAAVVAPLWVYELSRFGGLFTYPMATMNLAAGTAVDTSDPWRLYRTLSLTDVVIQAWPRIAAKAFRGFFGEFVPGLMTLWDLPLVVLALAAGLGREKDEARRRFLLLGAGLLLLQGLAFSPLRLELSIPNPYYRGRYFFWFAPTLLLAGSAAFASWLPAGRRGARLCAAFVALNVLVALGDFAPTWYHFDARREPAAAAFARLDPQTTVLVSNMASQAAAYYRLNSIELPLTPDELRALLARHRVTHFYLDGAYYMDDTWRRLVVDPAAWRRYQASIGLRRVLVVRDAQGRFEGELLAAAP